MSSQSVSSLAFTYLLLLTTSFIITSSADQNPAKITDGFRVDLIRVDSRGNFTALERLQRAVKRSSHRLARVGARITVTTSSGEDTMQTPVLLGDDEFLMELSIGSPPLPFLAILDTGSDLIWIQCLPCFRCYKQPTPIFDPSKSSSYKKLPCSSDLCHALPSFRCIPDCRYYYYYQDYSSTRGILGMETFTIGKTQVPNIGFGCGEDNEGPGFTQGAGLVGLGRGPLSLISQLGLPQFSYCFTPIDDANKTSKLIFGAANDIINTSESLSYFSTPFVRNPVRPTFYYISLEGITVGSVDLWIPKSTFSLKPDGGGGMVIDSGTTITYLESAGYYQLKKAFLAQVDLPLAGVIPPGLDLCWSWPSSLSTVKFPNLIFHFKGADLDLPSQNYLIGDESSDLLCLAIIGSKGISILGNIQQQNFHIVYDLGKETLSFAPAQCDKL